MEVYFPKSKIENPQWNWRMKQAIYLLFYSRLQYLENGTRGIGIGIGIGIPFPQPSISWIFYSARTALAKIEFPPKKSNENHKSTPKRTSFRVGPPFRVGSNNRTETSYMFLSSFSQASFPSHKLTPIKPLLSDLSFQQIPGNHKR